MVRGWVLGLVLFASALTAPVRSARAQDPGPAAPTADGSLLTERARLQAGLKRVNAEVDALKAKASARGLREDYRLRSRMADAEDLARRLTELDTRIGASTRAAPRTDAAAWPIPPRVDPSDDRGELEAKADILTDQARQLAGEANRLETRLGDLRARRQLRRRAGQLEDDPFSPLEQAKGRVGVSAGITTLSGGTKTAAPPQRPSAAAGGVSDSSGSSPPTGTTTDLATTTLTTSPSAQLRGALDPSSLAEIRKLDGAGSSPANLAAMERAILTLRQRSAVLDASARQLRARVAPTHP